MKLRGRPRGLPTCEEGFALLSAFGPTPNMTMLLDALALVDNMTLETAIQKLHVGELG